MIFDGEANKTIKNGAKRVFHGEKLFQNLTFKILQSEV